MISTVLSWFGFARKKGGNATYREGEHMDNTQNTTRGSKSKKNNKRGKLFDKSEGEYVDFEEIK